MQPLDENVSHAADVQAGDNLESMIALSGGDTQYIYRVMEGEQAIGQLDMKDLVKALVPRVSSTR